MEDELAIDLGVHCARSVASEGASELTFDVAEDVFNNLVSMVRSNFKFPECLSTIKTHLYVVALQNYTNHFVVKAVLVRCFAVVTLTLDNRL